MPTASGNSDVPPSVQEEVGRTEVFPAEVESSCDAGVIREKRKRSHTRSGQSATDSGLVSEEPPGLVARDSQSSEESATSDYSSGGSSCAEQNDRMLLHRGERAMLQLRQVPQASQQQALLLKRARRFARQEHRRSLELQYALLSDADGDRSVMASCHYSWIIF